MSGIRGVCWWSGMIVLCLKETLYLDCRRAVRGVPLAVCHLMIVTESEQRYNGTAPSNRIFPSLTRAQSVYPMNKTDPAHNRLGQLYHLVGSR